MRGASKGGLAFGIQYGFEQTYGFSGYGGALVVGLLAGVTAAAAFCGAAVLLGSRRSVLVIGVVVLAAVTVGAVASSWLGGRARDQGLLAAATACGARVGDYAVELGAVVGDVVNQNAWSRDDVSVSYRVDANRDKSANLLELRAWRTG